MTIQDSEKLNREIAAAFARVGEPLEEFAARLNALFEQFAEVLKAIIPVMRKIALQLNFERYAHETFLQWGQRLQKEGYFDDPHYRWRYQVATFKWFSSPFNLIIRGLK